LQTRRAADDVENNRANYLITSWRVDPAKVTVAFDGTCQTNNGPRNGDACSKSSVEWKSDNLKKGTKGDVVGVDLISAVYLDHRWWLCSSDFDGMQPTLRQVPPSVASFSTTATFMPSCAARTAQTYPPGPVPMTTRS